MDALSWITVIGLILTFVIAPLAVLFYRFLVRLHDRLEIIHTNHLPHIELYLKTICDHMGLEYEKPNKEI